MMYSLAHFSILFIGLSSTISHRNLLKFDVSKGIQSSSWLVSRLEYFKFDFVNHGTDLHGLLNMIVHADEGL
jgi:hypothetical protein